jgi:Outer membrane protein/protective antigen OMA87
MYGAQRGKDHSEFTPLPDDEGNVPLPAISDVVFTMSGVVPSYNYDSRDNPFDTTRGVRGAVSLGYEGGPFGGTVDIFKPEVNYSLYHRLSRLSSVSFNIEAGQIFPQITNCADLFADLSKYNNQLCVPRSERFYVGGEQSVRGFRAFSLGPKETVGGSTVSVGGYKKLILNAEYIFRVNEPLRFVLFADGGQAYGPNQNWDPGMLRFSTGAELRIFLPVFQFPLRFIYAFNPDPHPGDDFQAFQFSIGNTF